MKNLAIAIISSALAVSICTFFLGLAEEYPGWQGSAVMAETAAVVSLIALVCVTLPLHFALTHTGKVAIGWYVFPGTLIGPAFVLGLKPFGQDPTLWLIVQSLICGLLGAIGAAVFWFIAVRRRSRT